METDKDDQDNDCFCGFCKPELIASQTGPPELRCECGIDGTRHCSTGLFEDDGTIQYYAVCKDCMRRFNAGQTPNFREIP